LKRCSIIEMRWNKYEVSLTSPNPIYYYYLFIYCARRQHITRHNYKDGKTQETKN